MTTTSVSFNPYRGTLAFRAPFTQDSVFATQEMLSLLVTYYHHKRITLHINSPGGEAGSMAYLLDALSSLRAQGIEIQTLGEMTVASAGAILLAHGQVGTRTIHPGTTLLFHDARCRGAEPQTYAETVEIADRLSQTTRDMISAITNHVKSSLGGWLPLASEGQARCDRVRTHLASACPSSRTDAMAARRVQKAIADMWCQCVRKRSLKPYLDLLDRRFAADKPMPAYEAYGLALVDCVIGVEGFMPFASAPGSEITSVPLRRQNA